MKKFKKITISYAVVDKQDYISGAYFCGNTIKECIDYIKNEFRNRNKNDGHDEYWHNKEFMIVKHVVSYEDVGIDTKKI